MSSSSARVAVQHAPRMTHEERNWSWLGAPKVPILLGCFLAVLDMTADENTSYPFEGVAVGALCLLTVLVALRTAAGRGTRQPYLCPKVAAALWLASIPGISLGAALAGSPPLAAFLLLPAIAVGYGLSDLLNARWPLSVAVALAGATVIALLVRLGIGPTFAQVIPAAVAAALLLAFGVIAVRALSVSR